MGVTFSCLTSKYINMENGFEAILLKPIHLGKTLVRSVSFRDRDSQPTVMKSLGSGNKIALEASISFKTIEPGTAGLFEAKREEAQSETSLESPILDRPDTKHDAALKLQKVYKSFRTRRQLADCAVLVQQGWWEVLDFVELNNSSVSFFDECKHETAISRWSRARTRAAKVGKGLSKNDKAQKLAFQHWLEAIDPRHRYGHNLQFYYVEWLHSQSREPFFYWLDVGEGKEVNLLEKCQRWKLQQQCIKYLGPMERKVYEVSLADGKLFYRQTGKPVHTTGKPGDGKWIFVLSTTKTMYVGRKKKGSFQHSSFLAGGAALAAGQLVVEDGILKAAWPHSGHYQPTVENFQDFLSFLQENNVDLKNVKLPPVDEPERSFTRSSTFLRSNPSLEDLAQRFDSPEVDAENSTKERRDSREKEASTYTRLDSPKPSRIQRFGEKLTDLEIPKNSYLIERSEIENPYINSPTGGYETAEDAVASGHDRNQLENILEEPVLEMNSNSPTQESKSLQVGKQLCGTWTTGAGPRIRYVRDYPPELQVRALEQVNLSPRSLGLSGSYFSPRIASGLSPAKLSLTEREKDHSSEGIIGYRLKSSLSRRVSE